MHKTLTLVGKTCALLFLLLVVAAILFPIFGSPPDGYRHNLCSSNEKQIGFAILQYAQDNDDHLPNIADKNDAKSTWRVALDPYAKSIGVYQCPLRRDQSHGPDGYPRSYAANYTGDYSGLRTDVGDGAFGGPGSHGVTLGGIFHPNNLIMLCEVTHHTGPDFNIDNLAAFDPGNTSLFAGHADGSNYLLADGHVKFLRPQDTKDLWHRNGYAPLAPASVKMLEDAGKRRGE